MRQATVLMLALLLSASTAMAQQSPNAPVVSDPHKTVKIVAGIGALAVGTAIAAWKNERAKRGSDYTTRYPTPYHEYVRTPTPGSFEGDHIIGLDS